MTVLERLKKSVQNRFSTPGARPTPTGHRDGHPDHPGSGGRTFGILPVRHRAGAGWEVCFGLKKTQQNTTNALNFSSHEAQKLPYGPYEPPDDTYEALGSPHEFSVLFSALNCEFDVLQ